jgi:hypothetical protein
MIPCLLKRIRAAFRRRPGPSRVFVLNTDLPAELTPAIREDLRAWLALPTTKLALSLVESRRPPLSISGSGTTVRNKYDERAVLNRFHQLQGWEWFLNRLVTLPDRDDTKKEPLQENYQPTEE